MVDTGLMFGLSWLQFISVVTAILVGYMIWYYTLFIRSGIPGPMPLPFYANIQRSREAYYKCEEKWVKTYGEVLGFFSVSGPTLLISNVNLIKQIRVREFSSFRNRGGVQFSQSARMRNMLINLKDDQWKKTRTTISAAFSLSKMKVMAGILNECADEILLQKLRQTTTKGQALDTRKLFGSYSIGCIATAGFGLQLKTQSDDEVSIADFEKNCKGFFSRIKTTKWLLLSIFQKYIPQFIIEYFDVGLVAQENENFFFDNTEVILKKREEEQTQEKYVDFLQLLVNAHKLEDDEEGQRSPEMKISAKVPLTMDDVVSQCVMFLLAGYETTSACLVFTSYLLATNPDVQDKLASEIVDVMSEAKSDCVTADLLAKMPYLGMVINESLRVYPPVARASRICTKSTTLQGIHFKKGVRVIIPVWTIHHNPDLWKEPLTFNPNRFSAENKDSINLDAFLPFGEGPRSCIGDRFAMMEIKIALVRILKEFKLSMAENNPKTLQLGKGVFLAPSHPVNVQFVSRTRGCYRTSCLVDITQAHQSDL